MIPILSITVAPAALMLAVAYALRPQCGRQRVHPVPAPLIIARLADEPNRTTTFGPSPAFTVQTRTLWSAA